MKMQTGIALKDKFHALETEDLLAGSEMCHQVQYPL